MGSGLGLGLQSDYTRARAMASVKLAVLKTGVWFNLARTQLRLSLRFRVRDPAHVRVRLGCVKIMKEVGLTLVWIGLGFRERRWLWLG